MNELESKISSALDEWMTNSNRLPMIELLKPFGDTECLDILESYQKGCDHGWIEIQGNLIAPMHDIESGEAILFLAQWLREDDSGRVVISLGDVCEVTVLSRADVIVAEAHSVSAAEAMLMLIVLKYTPKEPGE